MSETMQESFCHEVLFYDDADQFLAGTVPFLTRALESGEPALVAVGKAKSEMLRGELGDDAGIRFVAMEDLGRNPARIIPFWRDFIDEHGGRDRPVRGIGEPVWPGRNGAQIDECQRHEELLNLAFGEEPPWRLLCPYDSSALEDDVLEAARRNHPYLTDGGATEENSKWAGIEGAPGPFVGTLPPRPSTAKTLDFDRGALHEVRRLVAQVADRQLDATRCADLVTAASELAANSVLHGGGSGRLAIWEEEDDLLVEVEDDGWIEEPLTGRRRPDPTQVSGRGLWLANALCDLAQIRSGPAGTAIRLHMAGGA